MGRTLDKIQGSFIWAQGSKWLAMDNKGGVLTNLCQFWSVVWLTLNSACVDVLEWVLVVCNWMNSVCLS